MSEIVDHGGLDLCVCGDDLIGEISDGYGNFPYTEGVFTIECSACGREVEVEAEAHITFELTIADGD